MTNVTLPDELADQVSSVTTQELSAFVEAAVRQVLVSRRTRGLERAARVAPFGGAGVLPDIDLTRLAEALDLPAAHPAGLTA